MDHDDDESPFTSLPNHFLLSTYKENISMNANQTKIDLRYKCRLCRKIRDNPILTCSNCVNTGQFCSSKHDKCTIKQREFLLKLLNKNNYEEFQQYSTNQSIHLK